MRFVIGLAAVVLGCGGVVHEEPGEASGSTGDAQAPDEKPIPGPPPEDVPEEVLGKDACVPGEAPFTIATVSWPDGIALGGGSLFFVEGGGLYDCDGTVFAVPLEGGEPIALATEQCSPRRVVYAGGTIYWLSYIWGSLYALDLEGGGEPELVTLGLESPTAIAVDDRYVYVGSDVADGLQSPGKVVRFDRETFASVDIGGSPGSPMGIALDGDHVYWTGSVGFLNGKENHDSAVWRVSKDGGEPVELAGGLAMPMGIARATTRVVWANGDDGQLMSMGADGTAVVELAGGFDWLEDVAVAGGEAFFTTSGPDISGAVHRVMLDGTAAPTKIAEGIGMGDQIALGATCVYWTEQYIDDVPNGVVRKAAR